MRVAIVGARGIGRFHAAWWALEGAEVCAIAGSSQETVSSTQKALGESMGFRGRGYPSVEEMLRSERPDILDVCSPAHLHACHVEAGLRAGCHVLCEKPFVFGHEATSDQMLEEANRRVDLAERSGLRLGVCMQYAVSARSLLRLWQASRPNERITRFRGELASPSKGRLPDPDRVWMDLGPHPLSALQKVAPAGRPDWSTLTVTFKDFRAEAQFDVVCPSGDRLSSFLTVHNVSEPPLNIRRFAINDEEFVIDGVKDSQGIFQARIVSSAGAHDEEDAMRLLIRDFLSGTPTVDGRSGLTNMEWLLKIREAGMLALSD